MNTIDRIGDVNCLREIISRSINHEYNDDQITKIESGAFRDCISLTSINMSSVTEIGNYAFQNCKALANVDIPVATTLKESAFQNCTALTNVSLPAIKSISYYAFYGCSALTTVIIRTASQIATLAGTNAFSSANNAIIYVPDDLVESYKTASNWSTYADRIKGLSELPSAS